VKSADIKTLHCRLAAPLAGPFRRGLASSGIRKRHVLTPNRRSPWAHNAPVHEDMMPVGGITVEVNSVTVDTSQWQENGARFDSVATDTSFS